MTNELIPVTTRPIGSTELVQTVNARALHGFLSVGRDFSPWIKDRTEILGFAEGADWVREIGSPVLGNQTGRGGDRRSIDYFLSLDMAKHLCMIERNEKGMQARAYFIEMERQAKQRPALNLNDPATLRQMLLGYTETVMRLEVENAAVTADNDNLRHENNAITAVNAVLDDELQMVTIDE